MIDSSDRSAHVNVHRWRLYHRWPQNEMKGLDIRCDTKA